MLARIQSGGQPETNSVSTSTSFPSADQFRQNALQAVSEIKTMRSQVRGPSEDGNFDGTFLNVKPNSYHFLFQYANGNFDEEIRVDTNYCFRNQNSGWKCDVSDPYVPFVDLTNILNGRLPYPGFSETLSGSGSMIDFYAGKNCFLFFVDSKFDLNTGARYAVCFDLKTHLPVHVTVTETEINKGVPEELVLEYYNFEFNLPLEINLPIP